MMSLTFGLFTQVSGSGPLGPLVLVAQSMLVFIKNNSMIVHFTSMSLKCFY